MDKTTLRALLDTTVHVLGDMNPDGSHLWIQNGQANYGTTATPIFSSVEVLQQSVDASQSYLSMPARALFELFPNTHFVLNPKSVGRFPLSPQLVKQLLDGSYFVTEPVPPKPAIPAQNLGTKLRSILSLRQK